MKKRNYITFSIILLFLFLSGTAMANRLIQERGIYPNQSAEYVRTLNRSASTDADAAFYNPAGLAYIGETGLYVMFSGQTYYAKKTHTMDYYAIKLGDKPTEMTYHTKEDFTGNMPDEYFAETTAPILPDLDIIFKGKTDGHEWAAYFDLSVLQAAPNMNFPLGLAVIDWGNLAEQESVLFDTGQVFEAYNADAKAVRTEYLIGGTLGGAYKVTKWFSVALGGRYIYAMGNMNIQVDNISYTVDGTTSFGTNWLVDTDYKGHGGSVIAGIHFKFEEAPDNFPKWLRPFDIGFKIEYHTPITMKKTTNNFVVPGTVEASGSLNLFKDGTPSDDMVYEAGNGESEFTFQYPTQFNLGISYKILKNLKVETSTEITLRKARDLSGEEDDYKPIGFKIGLCVEWGFMKNVVGSVGYLYNDFGIKEELRDEADMMLPSHAFGGGISVSISERLNFTIGAYIEMYVPNSTYSTEYTNVTAPTYHYISKDFKENRYSVGWGVTYRFLGGSPVELGNQKKNMDL